MLFEDQASEFDDRVGLLPEARESVIRTLVDMVRLEPGDTLLEIGAGTGGFGLDLLRLPIRYIAFDRSPAMLGVFREKMEKAGLQGELHVADGNERWPVEDGSISVIFSVRALHYIATDHVVAEARRVLRPAGGWLVVGRTRNPQGSLKMALRRQMRLLLEQEGYVGLSRDQHAETVFSLLEKNGGLPVHPRDAAQWTRLHRPEELIAVWENKEGLGGIDIPEDAKARVMAGLRAWASDEFGDPNREIEQTRFLELSGIYIQGE